MTQRPTPGFCQHTDAARRLLAPLGHTPVAVSGAYTSCQHRDETADETPQAHCPETVLTQENSTLGHLQRPSLLGKPTSSWPEPSVKNHGDVVTNGPAIGVLKWAEATLRTGPMWARQALFGPTKVSSQQAPDTPRDIMLAWLRPYPPQTPHSSSLPRPGRWPQSTWAAPATRTPEEQIRRWTRVHSGVFWDAGLSTTAHSPQREGLWEPRCSACPCPKCSRPPEKWEQACAPQQDTSWAWEYPGVPSMRPWGRTHCPPPRRVT